MRQLSSFIVRGWFVFLLLIVGVLLWQGSLRVQRIQHVAELIRGESIPSADSLTGYEGGVRESVLSDHDNRSYEWIAEAQRLLAHGDWRVRRVDAENAPNGRASYAPSPYRWWLGMVSWVDHQITGVSAGAAVERARIYADPLLQLIILISLVAFASRYAGSLGAILAAAWTAFLYPFAARYFPGVPDESTLLALIVLGSILPLYLGLRDVLASGNAEQREPAGSDLTARAWRSFALSGVLGGVGFWLSPSNQATLVVGIAAGALIVAWIVRSTAMVPGSPLPGLWRIWSVSGSLAVLAAYFAEYYPGYLGAWELRAVHPLYGLAWLGLGELLVRFTASIQRGTLAWNPREIVIMALSVAAVAAVPLAMYRTGNPGVLAADTLFFRLTNQPDGVMAQNILGWVRDGNATRALWATLLPTGILAPAFWLLLRRGTATRDRAAIAITVVPAVLVAAVACVQVRQWLMFDTVAVALLIVVTRAVAASRSVMRRAAWAAAAVLVLLPGFLLTVPSRKSARDNVMTLTEALGVVERDMAHWLSRHHQTASPVLVLAPPRLTTTLIYYGGLRGVATLAWENQEGLAFAIRTAISTSRNETAALLRQRGVTHIVLPSWDRFFDSYVQSASVQLGELFYPGLERWNLPLWLKPVPFHLPSIPGFEKHSVKVFEVVEDQDAPIAAARLTEYFIEMNQLEEAKASQQNLLKFPADFSAQVARAQLQAALGDEANFGEILEPLLGRLRGGADRYLPWDRRLSLAMVLAQGNQMDLARAQLERCVADITDGRLRSITSLSLYRFLALNRNFGISITDPKLRELALNLLPTAMKRDF